MEGAYTTEQRLEEWKKVYHQYHDRLIPKGPWKTVTWKKICQELAFAATARSEAREIVMKNGVLDNDGGISSALRAYEIANKQYDKILERFNTFLDTDGEALF